MHISRFSSATALVVTLGLASGCQRLLVDDSVASVEIAPRTIELEPGDSLKISATILGPNGAPVSRPVVRWRSSDTTVVQVSSSGSVRPIRAGNAVVTAAAGRYSDSGTVRGAYPPLSGIIEYAHRAFGGIFPENTLTAVNGAFDRGADGVEVDVRLSADGVPVIMHDATVDRTTNGHGGVDQLTFDQLRLLDACSRAGAQWSPCAVPTPLEVLSAAQHRGRVILDLKGPWPVNDIGKLLKTVESLGMIDSVMFTSFDLDVLRSVRRAAPRIVVGYLQSDPGDTQRMLDIGHVASLIEKASIGRNASTMPAYVAQVQAGGSLLGAFTLTAQSDVALLKAAGVSWYISDVPLDKTQLTPRAR